MIEMIRLDFTIYVKLDQLQTSETEKSKKPNANFTILLLVANIHTPAYTHTQIDRYVLHRLRLVLETRGMTYNVWE